MSPLIEESPCAAHWTVKVFGAISGELSLYATRAGYVWNWHHKPAHLVSLKGVLEDDDLDSKFGWSFGDLDDAIRHVMDCTGAAFGNQCALEAPLH